jgi:hypothetical protein
MRLTVTPVTLRPQCFGTVRNIKRRLAGVLRVEISPEDLARSRFAVSPLVELETLLRSLQRSYPRPTPGIERLRPDFERLRRTTMLPVLLAVQTSNYGPSFLAPPPRGMGQTIDDDLAAVRATPLALARDEIRQATALQPVADPDVAQVLRSPAVVATIAGVLEESWHVLIGPTWAATRALLERDVLHRASRLTRDGWAAAFEGLHERLRWRDGGIDLLGRPDERVLLGGGGLMLVSSVHVWRAR